MMKQLAEHFWFRLLASGVVASVVIVAVVGGGIRYYEPKEEDPLIADLKEVRVISLGDNPALADAVRRERERSGTLQARRQPPPPPLMSERKVSGFVQLEYTINADGSVSDVKVLGAAPAGVYEERAVAQVARRMHAPTFNDAGEATARRATEVVEFSVPATELLKSK